MMSIVLMIIFMMLLLLFSSNMLYYIQNIMFMLSLIMLMKFNFMNLYWVGIYSFFGMDKYSFMLNLLSVWILAMMILSINKCMKFLNFMLLMKLLLLLFLMLCFSCINYFGFYLFFESSLIPTFILIIGWGYQPERIKASMYLLLYTMMASLPLLLMIFYLMNYFNSLNYLILLNSCINLLWGGKMQFLFYMFMILAFLIKLPIFFFHLWLPKAHVEAPIFGSMVLAGVMLKLGGYGIYRVMFMMMNLSIKFNYIFMVISVWGGIIMSLISLIQIDLKMLVAYSSVVHMSLMLMSLMTLTMMGVLGAFLMMLSHGLVSSGMFCLVNFNYERIKSRNIFINKGMMLLMPSMSLWWFLICSVNMSSPPSLNLLSELMIIISLISWDFNLFIFLMPLMFYSAIYSIYLFSKIQHGGLSKMVMKVFPNFISEYLLMIFHWMPLNLIILKIDIFL